ncbi:hypothetical protein HDV02_002264 [Globomyces sp. JEL0801]|nr:hypothetical protein HDV02_002264 [Globomyces sp. JEL0801]
MKPNRSTRASKACDLCSQNRKKCAGGIPCANCTAKGIECTFNKPSRKRGPNKGSSNDLRQDTNLDNEMKPISFTQQLGTLLRHNRRATPYTFSTDETLPIQSSNFILQDLTEAPMQPDLNDLNRFHSANFEMKKGFSINEVSSANSSLDSESVDRNSLIGIPILKLNQLINDRSNSVSVASSNNSVDAIYEGRPSTRKISAEDLETSQSSDFNNQMQSMNLFNNVDVEFLPLFKYQKYPRLPLETVLQVMPNIIIEIDKASTIKLPDGTDRPWIEAFFLYVHPSHPVLLPKWTMENVDDLPLELLHIMYALVISRIQQLIDPNRKCDSGELHYRYTELLLPSLDDTNIFLLIAFYFKSIYASLYGHSYLKGSSICAGAVRGLQFITTESPMPWVNPDGQIRQMDHAIYEAHLYQLWLALYERDFFLSLATRLPFVLSSGTKPIPLKHNPIYLKNDVNFVTESHYSRSNNFSIELLTSSLLTISRKILEFLRSTNFDRNDDWKYTEGLINQELHHWLEHLPMEMKTTYDNFDKSTMPLKYFEWMTLYLHSFFYTSMILLHQRSFLETFQTHFYSSPCVYICKVSAEHIYKILRYFQRYNPQYDYIPSTMGYFATVGGAIHSILRKLTTDGNRINEIAQMIDLHIDVIEYFRKLHSHDDKRSGAIKIWLQNEELSLQAFAKIV